MDLTVCFFHCKRNPCGMHHAFPSQGMCHEIATKGTGKGLEPQMQEYGCRKMNFADIRIVYSVHFFSTYIYILY